MTERGFNFPQTTRYIVLEFEKKQKLFLLQHMSKNDTSAFHDASILVSVGVSLTHRFETVGVFAHFLCVKKAKTPSIWSSVGSEL